MLNNLANLELIVESEQRLFETAYGDPIPFSEFPNNDWADISTWGQYGAAFTSIYDRQDGKNFPIYQTEQDLAQIRAQVRRFLTLSEISEAANTALQVYIFGANGISYTIQPQKGVADLPPGLIEDIRRIVDRFADNNSLVNSLDIELHRRSRDDGEVQVSLSKDPFKPRNISSEFVECDQLRKPLAANNNDFENWMADQHDIDCSSFVPSWSFGVLTPERNTARVLGYHVQHDSSGNDWDFFPAEQFVHVKRNVTRNMKRGISDYYAIKDRVSQAAKLMRNMAHGGALQAAIAWVEESPSGTQAGQLPGIGNIDAQYQKPTNIGNGGGTRTQRQTTYSPGSILRPTNGRVYKPGPMGAERNAGFEVVLRCILQAAASRFLMPYQMLSSDASTNNFSSSLVAESPFVKAREWDQAFYGGAIESMLWKVITIAWRWGWLDLRGFPFSRLQQAVSLTVNFPQVATRDRSALVKDLVQEVTILGTTSIKTAATDLGRDYDDEVAAGAKADSTKVDETNPGGGGLPQQPAQPGELANASTLQFRRNVKAINEILTAFKTGKNTRAHAKQLLLSVGMQDARAESLLDDAADKNGADTETLSAVESVKILESSLFEGNVSGESRDGNGRWSGVGSPSSNTGGHSEFHQAMTRLANVKTKHRKTLGGMIQREKEHWRQHIALIRQAFGHKASSAALRAIESVFESCGYDPSRIEDGQIERAIFESVLLESHDVSGEARDDQGEWTSGGASHGHAIAHAVGIANHIKQTIREKGQLTDYGIKIEPPNSDRVTKVVLQKKERGQYVNGGRIMIDADGKVSAGDVAKQTLKQFPGLLDHAMSISRPESANISLSDRASYGLPDKADSITQRSPSASVPQEQSSPASADKNWDHRHLRDEDEQWEMPPGPKLSGSEKQAVEAGHRRDAITSRISQSAHFVPSFEAGEKVWSFDGSRKQVFVSGDKVQVLDTNDGNPLRYEIHDPRLATEVRSLKVAPKLHESVEAIESVDESVSSAPTWEEYP